MNKEQLDTLYHLLRVASNEPSNDRDMFSTQHIISGLARHLLLGGDYLALVQYSAFYGEHFLLDDVVGAIVEAGWDEHTERIVDFGAGLGWLGRGLSQRFGIGHLLVDKRPWGSLDTVADLETYEGRKLVKEQLKLGDLIVMSDFLHCLDNAFEILLDFRHYPMAVLEYCPRSPEFAMSYAFQIERYGASPFTQDDLETLFFGIETLRFRLDPYILILADRRNP